MAPRRISFCPFTAEISGAGSLFVAVLPLPLLKNARISAAAGGLLAVISL
jgi:hypothetical protein